MAPGLSLQSDFTAGELSPALLSRVDLTKYMKGCRTMRNFLARAHGGAAKRPGFLLLGELPGEAVLFEFIFNNEQTYALVFGEQWMRVATHEGFVLGEDGKIYEIATPYTLEQAKRLSMVQSADVLFIACQGVRPQRLMRFGHADWKFEGMQFLAPLDPPEWDTKTEIRDTSTYARYPGTAYTYVPEAWESIGDSQAYIPAHYARIPGSVYAKNESSVTVHLPNIEFVNEAKMSDGGRSPAQCVTPYTYYVTAVDKDGKESTLSEGAEITGPSSNNWQGGDYIILRWKAIEGIDEYRIYKAAFGGRAGYIAMVGETAYKDYNVTPSISEGAPKYDDPFPDDDFPGAVCLFEQRLVFASSPKRPQTIWMSKSGDYGNFATYTPHTADSPIELTIASQEVTPANWMVPLRSLILGTSGMEWEISGRGETAFSAQSARVTPQSYWGSSLRRAMVVGNIILHVSSSGSQVRNLQYDFGSDSYGGSDLSILAAHLLEEAHIVDWAYQKNPDSIIWAVRSDGVLLGLTFQAEHQISAWHRHDTQGRFLALCSVPRGQEHDLFCVVERFGRHFLERMAKRHPAGEPSRAVFLDAAMTYEGEPARTISGLDHLEGQRVGVFSEGAVENARVVTNGSVTLDSPSRLVTVGLPYTADLESMPVEVLGAMGASIGLKKQISTVNIAFYESMGVKVGLSDEPGNVDGVQWQDVKWRTTEACGQPPAPFTGLKHLTVPCLARNTLSVCVRSDTPTPVTLQSIMTRIEVKG